MKYENKTKEQLINELAELRQRISELKTSESLRKRAEEALRESEMSYRTLFERAGDAILILEAEGGNAGKTLAANQASTKHQIMIPDEIRKKAKISVGDNLKISYEHGKILVEKIDENWENVMEETKGAWRKHPILKDMDYTVETVNWMRGNK